MGKNAAHVTECSATVRFFFGANVLIWIFIPVDVDRLTVDLDIFGLARQCLFG